MTVFELCLNLPFHAFLQCFCFAPHGTTNPWSQTGSMRVRGQTFIAWFLFFYFILLHTWLRHTLPPSHPSLLRDAEPSSSAAEHIAFDHLFLNSRHVCPPASSNPPLLLPHLVLSVTLPIPVSHALILAPVTPSLKLLQSVLHSWCWLWSPCLSAVSIALFTSFWCLCVICCTNIAAHVTNAPII